MGRSSHIYHKGILISWLILLVLGSCALAPQEGGNQFLNAISSQSAASLPSCCQVYFTEPGTPQASTLRGGPDAALADAIDQARLSVDIAVDSLELWSLRDALLAAHRRGITVRVVVDSDNLAEEEVQALLAGGIPVVDDHGDGLMHNKFVIIDRQDVWTGSMNLTLNGVYRSNNNLVHVRSFDLAEDYLVEFEEMFVEGRFGPKSPADTPYPLLTVAGTQLEVYFSPEDGTIDQLVELVQSAESEILFMAYSFTDDELAQAMLERATSGVHLAGVLDESQARANIGGVYNLLLENGIDVHLDGLEGSMHHKVIVIDGRIVVTGSYNFSNNAKTRNDENTLVLHSAAIAALFREEFQRVYAQAK